MTHFVSNHWVSYVVGEQKHTLDADEYYEFIEDLGGIVEVVYHRHDSDEVDEHQRRNDVGHVYLENDCPSHLSNYKREG